MSHQDPLGLVTRPSSRSVKATLQRLEATVGKRGLTVFARFDHSDAAAAAGLPMPASHVLVFGSPRAGTPLMLANPLIALELPLRVLVWADTAGDVYVTYPDPAHLAARYGIGPALVPNIAALDAIVAAAL